MNKEKSKRERNSGMGRSGRMVKLKVVACRDYPPAFLTVSVSHIIQKTG
jgi:hypothetical protein